MIKKLKRKFLFLAMTALLLLLAVIVTGMNLINYNGVIAEADEILSVLAQYKGTFPEMKPGEGGRFPHGLSPETPYESRYFSVFLDDSGKVLDADTGMTASVDTLTALSYAAQVLERGSAQGFVGQFRYIHYSEPLGSRIVFLDCGRRLDAFYSFLYTSCAMALVGYGIVFVVMFFLSGRIIRPIAESYEKQKQFITDAGHELKTPLTIINANTDILEMDLGENECLQDIRMQARRLGDLTNDLVALSRMEEASHDLQKVALPISEIVLETAMPFRTLAQQQGKEFICQIQPLITMEGDDKSIRQLVSILMDNALKYSPAGGRICLELTKQNKALCLSVYNTTALEIKKETLPHVFDRFYRADSSRNSQTGGYGIGLSMARAIVTAHGGRIQASTRDGCSFQICATLPL